MSTLPVVPKRAAESLSLSTDWADVLASSETISGTPSWAVLDAAAGDSSPLATAGSAAVSGTIASQRVSAGSKGQVYRVRCTMVTSGTQTYNREISVRIIA